MSVARLRARVEALPVRHPFRRKNASLRLLPVYAAAVLVVAAADPTLSGTVAGCALVTAGAALRAWGAGHLVKNDRLTVSGPYAHLRHPLYAGSLLLGAGVVSIAGGIAWILLAAALAPAFFLYYLPYKERIESARLERRYGSAYAAYRDGVPLLVPTIAAWHPPADLAAEARRRWSGARFRANDELGTLLAVALLLAALLLRTALL